MSTAMARDGGRAQLRVDVFADLGRSREQLDEAFSAGMGVLSGFLAGRRAKDAALDASQ